MKERALDGRVRASNLEDQAAEVPEQGVNADEIFFGGCGRTGGHEPERLGAAKQHIQG
jgi:hypothetical protein